MPHSVTQLTEVDSAKQHNTVSLLTLAGEYYAAGAHRSVHELSAAVIKPLDNGLPTLAAELVRGINSLLSGPSGAIDVCVCGDGITSRAQIDRFRCMSAAGEKRGNSESSDFHIGPPGLFFESIQYRGHIPAEQAIPAPAVSQQYLPRRGSGGSDLTSLAAGVLDVPGPAAFSGV